jgi:hypothetical protein
MQEAGAIPISMRVNPMLQARGYNDSYWPLVFGRHSTPFLVHDSWRDARREADSLLAGPPSALEQRRQRVQAMWLQHKADIARFIEQHAS